MTYNLYTFGNQTGPIPLSELDWNFQQVTTANNITANTVSNPVQANITSLGQLTALSVAGNILSVGAITTSSTLTATGNLSTSSNVTATNMFIDNNGRGSAIITGNLQVQGTLTSVNSNNITTGTLTITVGNNLSSTNLTGAGIIAGLYQTGTLLYNYATNSWQSNIGFTPTSNIAGLNLGGTSNYWNTVYATQLVMSGNIISGNITSNAYSALTVTATGNVVAGNILTAGIVSSAGNITGINIFANSLSVVGTISLGGLTASGNLYANGITTGNATTANISTGNVLNSGNIFTTGVSASGQVLAAVITTGVVSATGNIAGNYILGNGSQLSGISNSQAIVNPGGWSVIPSGTKLYFNYNGSNLGSLDSGGNFIVTGNITAFGTP
jgi:hypothetical protein